MLDEHDHYPVEEHTMNGSFGGLALAAVIALVGCGTTRTMTEAVTQTFATEHSGCRGTVRERPDLPSSQINYSPWKGDYGTGMVYEVTGCNADVLYDCGMKGQHANEHGQTWQVGGECSNTRWCTPDGCDSFDLAARNTFMKDKTCPLERVTSTQHTPVIAAAPSDIAADPERMRLWTQTHAAQIAGHTFMTATGCGSEVVYDCQKPSGPRAIPVCAPAGHS